MKKNLIFLLLIVALAAFLRFYQLGTIPPSLTWDEAAWGYNAYSLGIDGRDEFGRFLPLDYLESFGDFKPPVYAYLDVIPIKIWGLTEFAVRFPSALFGVLMVLVTYFLVKRLFGMRNHVELLALLSALFLAISPWHINLSRAAFEANVATFFLVAGVLFFLWAMQERRWLLIVSAISFVLSIYTFNTARIVSPVLVLGLAFGFREQLLQRKRESTVVLLLGILVLVPTIPFLLSPQAKLRFEEVNIFSNLDVIERANQQIENDNNAWWSKILHNRRFAFTVEYARHYLDHFNPQFLFIKGDGNPKFSTQDIGQLYLWDLPFLIAGIVFLIKKREGYWWIIPLWLLLSIVPAATARETPHALRIEASLPTFQILVAYGVVYALHTISKIKYQIYVLTFLFLIFNFLYYYHGYYTHYAREYSGEWQYGYRESIATVEAIRKDFDQVNITTALGRPYIYYLFYTKAPPNDFRKTAIIQRDPYGFVHVEGFATYRFGDDLGKLDNENKRILYVNAANRAPQKANFFQTIALLNGEPVLSIYEIVYIHPETE